MLILQRIRRWIVHTQLRELILEYRHRGLKETDVFLASYPRSGSNWLKFLLLESIKNTPLDFHQSDLLMPYVGEHFNAPAVLPGNRRFIKTHERYRIEYKKAVYLVRDPRAVAVSEYRLHRDLRKYNEPFERFIVDFLNGRINGFGSWIRHVHSWLEADAATVFVVKFEDLRAAPFQTTAAILRFLDVEPSPGAIERAINNNTIERLREKEEQVRLTVRRSNMINNLKGDSHFVNDGAVRGWRNVLGKDHIQAIEQCTGELLDRLGYAREFPG